MSQDSSPIAITSQDFWFKVVEFLQQNWALIDENAAGATIWFVGDTSGVFDRIECQSTRDAEEALTRNGFHRFAQGPAAASIMRPPAPPFHPRPHPNGPIYSSGRYWK